MRAQALPEGARPVVPVRSFSFFRGLRISVAVVALLVLIEAAISGLGPLTASAFLDEVLPNNASAKLTGILILLGAAVILAFAAGALRAWLVGRAVGRSLGLLRHAMFDRLQRLSLAPKTDMASGELVDRFSVDFAALETALAAAVPNFILPSLEAIICSGFMIYLDWRVGLIALVFSPWIILAPILSDAQSERSRSAAREVEKQLLSLISENLRSQAMIRAFELEKSEFAAFRKRNSGLSRVVTRARTFTALIERVTGSGILGIRLFILGLSAWLTLAGSETLGSFVALQILAYIISNSLLLASGWLPALKAARAAQKRIGRLLRAPLGIVDVPNARFLPPLSAEIGFSDVHFRYGEEGTEQISGLTARIPKDSYVAFAGPSGCGKSTLLRLLMRFHDPSSGRITIDGHDLKSLNQASLRSRIGFVLQENALFNLSIRENIRIGKQDASEEAVTTAARITGLHDMIMALPHGYDSLAGEKGVRLSDSGMQRLAIARAMLRHPEILILDEATSALDPADERAVGETLRSLRQGRTVIAVSHRLSTVADAEHIFFMDQGTIVEQGSHFELLALNGQYAACWRKQAGFTFSPDGQHVDVDAQRLKAFPILEDVDDDVLAELAPYFATETFPPQREIVRQNDPGDKFYIIARGQVEVWRQEEKTGGTREVAMLQDGDFFGEITLLTGFPRTATVRTITYTTCISLERGHFNRMIARFPALHRKMSDIAVLRLRETSREASQPETPTLGAGAAKLLPEAQPLPAPGELVLHQYQPPEKTDPAPKPRRR